jgi:L-2-hydroxyglutarate oxidase LhgO
VALGVRILAGTRYRSRYDGGVRTDRGSYAAGFVVNAAGVYADRIAQNFGFGKDLEILPFKGLYLYQNAGAERLRTHIYPVPDLRFPWLGVHFTITVAGRVKIGPTATPAFWREHYEGIDRFDIEEFASIVSREALLFLTDEFGFRRLAWREMQKYSRSTLVAQAAGLASGIRTEDFREWGRPGIRAQLYNRRERRLEMDFCLDGDGHSLHVLNAVSPAFTCALSFADLVVDRIEAVLTS